MVTPVLTGCDAEIKRLAICLSLGATLPPSRLDGHVHSLSFAVITCLPGWALGHVVQKSLSRQSRSRQPWPRDVSSVLVMNTYLCGLEVKNMIPAICGRKKYMQNKIRL